eukprot:2490735-Amphidinium_carterae.2
MSAQSLRLSIHGFQDCQSVTNMLLGGSPAYFIETACQHQSCAGTYTLPEASAVSGQRAASRHASPCSISPSLLSIDCVFSESEFFTTLAIIVTILVQT